MLLSGNLRELASNIQKKFFQNIEHSKNEWISSRAMEMALAEDSVMVSHIMAWIKSFQHSKNQLSSTRSIG